MTDDKKPMKIEFAPGCFDQFDGSQEELDQLISKIMEMANSGELTANAVPLEDMLDELSDDEVRDIFEQLPEEFQSTRNLH